jgi:hypothetical protein
MRRSKRSLQRQTFVRAGEPAAHVATQVIAPRIIRPQTLGGSRETPVEAEEARPVRPNTDMNLKARHEQRDEGIALDERRFAEFVSSGEAVAPLG